MIDAIFSAFAWIIFAGGASLAIASLIDSARKIAAFVKGL